MKKKRNFLPPIKKCACGKFFDISFYPDYNWYLVKNGLKTYYCSYTCYRKAEKPYLEEQNARLEVDPYDQANRLEFGESYSFDGDIAIIHNGVESIVRIPELMARNAKELEIPPSVKYILPYLFKNTKFRRIYNYSGIKINVPSTCEVIYD